MHCSGPAAPRTFPVRKQDRATTGKNRIKPHFQAGIVHLLLSREMLLERRQEVCRQRCRRVQSLAHRNELHDETPNNTNFLAVGKAFLRASAMKRDGRKRGSLDDSLFLVSSRIHIVFHLLHRHHQLLRVFGSICIEIQLKASTSHRFLCNLLAVDHVNHGAICRTKRSNNVIHTRIQLFGFGKGVTLH